jgi:hypothetical protein
LLNVLEYFAQRFVNTVRAAFVLDTPEKAPDGPFDALGVSSHGYLPTWR